jgi:hypothetical protein
VTNEELAVAIINRLNDLILDPDVRKDVSRLLEERVHAGPGTIQHPTIQIIEDAPMPPQLGVLGLLNGICGTVQDGPKKGCGLITAVCKDEEYALESFCLTVALDPRALIHYTQSTVKREDKQE